MDRRSFMRWCMGGVAGAGGMMAASAGFADSFEGAVRRQLHDQGYDEITVERTLLGRVRIVAERDDRSREIILNPRTGEILRDVVLAPDGHVTPEIDDDDDDDSGKDRKDAGAESGGSGGGRND